VDRKHLLQLAIIFQLFIGALCADTTLTHQHDPITQMQIVGSMRHEHSGFLTANAFDDLRKDLLADVHIQCRNRIIHQHDLCSGVDGSGEAYPCFLSTGEINALCTDLRHITSRQNF
jgi:hypothetical protein